jgi:hypothetical protein
MLHDVNVS